MLCLILIVGVRLIMVGNTTAPKRCFYFRLEDQVPETHLLRLIEKHISFDSAR
jgi:hypothetical protein